MLALAQHLVRRTSTPLRRPVALLDTCVQGGLPECARYPFARRKECPSFCDGVRRWTGVLSEPLRRVPRGRSRAVEMYCLGLGTPARGRTPSSLVRRGR